MKEPTIDEEPTIEDAPTNEEKDDLLITEDE